MTKKSTSDKFVVSQNELEKVVKNLDQNRQIELKTSDMIFFEGSKKHLTCIECGVIPIEPHQCYTCNQILCGDQCSCICNVIQFENNGNSEGPKVKPVNKLMKQHVFDKLFFVHDCNPNKAKTDEQWLITAKIYSYAEIIHHLKTDQTCTIQSERKVACPKCCEPDFTKTELMEHLNTDCDYMEMLCTTCYQTPVARSRLKKVKHLHKQKQCMERLKNKNRESKNSIKQLERDINRQTGFQFNGIFRHDPFDDSLNPQTIRNMRDQVRNRYLNERSYERFAPAPGHSRNHNPFVRQDTSPVYNPFMRQDSPVYRPSNSPNYNPFMGRQSPVYRPSIQMQQEQRSSFQPVDVFGQGQEQPFSGPGPSSFQFSPTYLVPPPPSAAQLRNNYAMSRDRPQYYQDQFGSIRQGTYPMPAFNSSGSIPNPMMVNAPAFVPSRAPTNANAALPIISPIPLRRQPSYRPSGSAEADVQDEIVEYLQRDSEQQDRQLPVGSDAPGYAQMRQFAAAHPLRPPSPPRSVLRPPSPPSRASSIRDNFDVFQDLFEEDQSEI